MKKINTKKSKIILLGSISTIALAVIPAAVVACGSDSNNSTQQNSIDNFVTSFSNDTKISALNTKVLPSKIPTTLTSENVSTYFSNIPTSPDGIDLAYTTISNDTTGAIILSASASASGATTKTSSITINGFLTTNQSIINNFISELKTSTIVANANTAITEVPTTMTSANINTYFSGIPTITGTPSSLISWNYTISNVNTNTGTLDLELNASATNADPSSSSIINVKGFVNSHDANQNILNVLDSNLKAVVLSALYTQKSTKPSDIYTALQTLQNANPLTLANLSTYFNTTNIAAIVSPISGLNIVYTINPVTSELASKGQISININLSLGTGNSLVSQNIDLLVNGFSATILSSNQITQLASLNALATKLNNLNLVALNTQTKTQPNTIYSNLITNNSLALSDFDTYFDTTSITTDLATVAGVNTTYTLVSPTGANLANGTFNVLVTLSLGSGADLVSTTATLNITGFLTSIQANVDAYAKLLSDSNSIRGTNTILPSAITSANISQYLVNLPPFTSSQLSLSYSITNPNATLGSVDLVITVSAPNAKAVESSSITVTGFLNTNQNNINKYVAAINASTSITGTNTQLPSNLTATTIGSFLQGLPSLSAGLNVSYTIISSDDTTGSVTFEMAVSAFNAITISTNSIVVKGFKIQSIQSLLDSLTAANFNTTLAANTSYPPANGTFFNLPGWIYSAYNSQNDLIVGLPFSSIKSYTISGLNTVFGFAYITVLSNSGASSKKILLNNIGTINSVGLNSFYSTSISSISFSAANLAIVPSNFDKVTVSPSSSTDLIKLFSNIGINISNNSSALAMMPYISAYQLKVLTTDPTSGNITLSVTLYFTNPENNNITNNIYTISGTFLPSSTNPLSILSTSLAPGSVYGNYWSTVNITSGLGSSNSINSLYIPKPGSTTSEFKSDAFVATSGNSLPSFLINNINWPTGYSDANVVSWTETGNNVTGVATYNLTLNTINKVTSKPDVATLTVSGFMTNANATTLKGLGVNKLSNIGLIATPANGIVTNTIAGFTKAGISAPNWNNLNTDLFGGGVSTYSIINSNPTLGTANFLFTFKNGVMLSTQITGYSINSSLSSIVITPKVANSNAPANGTLSLAQAKTYFNFTNLTPQIEATLSTFVVSNSNGNGSVDLTITTNSGTSMIFVVTGFIDVITIINSIQSSITFQNNTGSLLSIANTFPNGKTLVITGSQILNNNIPSWVIISSETITLINQLITSGIIANNISITISPNYTTFRYPSSSNFTNPTNIVYSVVAGAFSNSNNTVATPATDKGLIFQSAQQYIKSVFSLSLNPNIINKQTMTNFIQTLSSPGNNFMGTISPNGSFTGGFEGNNSNMGNRALYTSAQWSLITSLFNLNLKPNVFWNLNTSNGNNSWYSIANIVAQRQANGILVRVYFGWNAYADTLIPNSDFMTPTVNGIYTQNILSVIQNTIPNDQSLNIFKENNDQPITFNLSNIPSWLTITSEQQTQINSIVAASGDSAQDFNITFGLPSYSSSSPNSDTTSIISASINGKADSTSTEITNNFAPAISLFPDVTSISLNPSILNNITMKQFITQYLTPNTFIDGKNDLASLQQMFNINIIPTWFSQWTVNNITWAVITPNLNSTSGDPVSLTVQIYINGNIYTTVTIPGSMFKQVTPNANETITNNIVNSIATNIPVGSSYSHFVNNQPITFDLNNIPSWITNPDGIKALAGSQDLSNIIVTISLPQYSYAPNPNNTTDSTAIVQISVSIKSGETLSDTSYTTSNNFQSARNYFESITTISLQSTYSSMTSAQLWTELSLPANSALTTSTGTNDLTLIQKFFNINFANPMFGFWNLSNISSVQASKQGDSGIIVTIKMQNNIWATFVITANSELKIANAIAQSVISNTTLTEFTSTGTKKAITFTLANIPSWITNQTAILALIPSGTNASDVSVSFALPTIITYGGTDDVTSMTFSTITVTINGKTATAVTNNFESATNYLQTITKVSLKQISKDMTYNDFWTNIAVAQGWPGGSGNNPNDWFQINIPSDNVFGWNANSFVFWVVATQLPNNVLEMKFMTQSNVWIMAYFNSSEFKAAPVVNAIVVTSPATDRLV